MTNYKDIKYQFPASATTSGTFADARISEASVTQHVTATDLQPIKSDLTALALREATNEASAAFNLPNQFIETFTDDTNLGTQTSGDRTSGYWGTVTGDQSIVLLMHMDDTAFIDSAALGITPTIGSGAGTSRSSAQSKFGSYSCYNTGAANCYLLYEGLGTSVGTGDFTLDMWVRPDNATTVNRLWSIGNSAVPAAATNSEGSVLSAHWNSTSYNFMSRIGSDSTWTFTGTTLVNNTWAHVAYQRTSGTSYTWTNGVVQGSSSTHITGRNMESYSSGGFTANDDLSLFARAGNTGEIVAGYVDEVRYCNESKYTGGSAFTPETSAYSAPATNATGTLIQSANTVASPNKTKVGGTMLYKDNAGTATLGTDLKIYFTANGGSNWTEAASYNAITPVYSTGIKQVRLGETTVTGGTDVRYKAVWANQASGSKETQLHGIGINY